MSPAGGGLTSGAIGPQYSRDDEWQARMRLHQSWYRAAVLRLPYGSYQSKNGARPLGSMLRPSDGTAGANFLDQQVHDVFRRRFRHGSADEVDRCARNMLSSQPMCFNLFGPLVDDPRIATRLLRALLPGDVEEVHQVRIEWAPAPRDQYLGDPTAFDAFVEYVDPSGRPSFLAIETKLTERFTPVRASDRGRYAAKYPARAAGLPKMWRQGVEAEVLDDAWFQLTRNHMLAEALRARNHAGYRSGRVMVVRHPNDHRGRDAVAGYRRLLRRGCDVVDQPLDALVDAWRAAVSPTSYARTWLDGFHLRYLNLAASEEHDDA